MTPSEAGDAAPKKEALNPATHKVARFEGMQSRWHETRDMASLGREALWRGLRHRRALAGAQSFVQFAGWPRSGHSLIGALIDAHPQAAIAHELDAMGLFYKGLSPRRIAALCLGNAAAFTAAGRHWNGYAYAVPGARHGPSGPLKVVGDKKGDWATRWSALDPELPGRFAEQSPLRSRWILVTRHPADNIATMSLRQGRDYDRLRIAAPHDMGQAIRDAQADGTIAAAARDDMIADYRALSAAVGALKTRVPSQDWHEITYKHFAADPRSGLADLARFLGLAPDPDWIAGAATLVRAGGGRSRDRVTWSDDQRAALHDTVHAHDFLSAYRDDL